MRLKSMKWQQLVLAFIATICFIFAGNALAQTDINLNNTNLIRFGGSITVPENQTVENALAFGGSVTVSPNARVVDTAIAFGGDVILKKGARVEGDAYSFGGKIVQEPGAIVGGERATFSDRHGMMYGSESPEERLSQRGRSSFFAQYFFSAIFRISAAVVAAILGLIVLHTSPQFLLNLSTKLLQHSGLTALWGGGRLSPLSLSVVFWRLRSLGFP
jgi:hypothetical protein